HSAARTVPCSCSSYSWPARWPPRQRRRNPHCPPQLPFAASTDAGAAAVAGVGVKSNSVLVALLDLHYAELAELVEKALLIQTLEDAVGRHNVTIFAPRNKTLERDLDPEFKRFLLEPRNLKSV
uniref:FAS1 domain-containing protein n=1 Tax=Triticum urartu TaxID=4572 RepID=A0A8R7TQ48_TRIUA